MSKFLINKQNIMMIFLCETDNQKIKSVKAFKDFFVYDERFGELHYNPDEADKVEPPKKDEEEEEKESD